MNVNKSSSIPTDGDVVTAAKQHVHDSGHHLGVQSILWRKTCDDSVGDSLRDGGEGDSEAGDKVIGQAGPRILGQPTGDGDAAQQVLAVAGKFLF